MKEELKRDKQKYIYIYNPVKSLEVVRESFKRKPIINKESEDQMINQIKK